MELELIKESATELREIISQVIEGEESLSDKETDIFDLIDGIKRTVSNYDKENDRLKDKVKSLEFDIEELEDESFDGSEINGSTISYNAPNLIDSQIMEALANCLHPLSGMTNLQLLNILESLPKRKAA